MQTLKLSIALAVLPMLSHAEDLTEADREALLDRIEEIQKRSESYVDQKYRAAMSAYSAAMASENSAMDLYLKCEEKLNFEEKKKKHSDFREWKKKNSDKFSDNAFRKALQFQLRWLVLTLKATPEDADREKLAAEAGALLDTMVSNAEGLAAHQSVLNQSVTSSIFAQAYDIGGIDVKDWPLSPGRIASVYDQLLLPPLRRIDRIEALKASWQKRILQEGVLVEKWRSNKNNTKSNERSPAFEKFVAETLPILRWNAEVDIYKAGDERGAAIRMLKHIEDNFTHKSATQWVGQFSELVRGVQNNELEASTETPVATE